MSNGEITTPAGIAALSEPGLTPRTTAGLTSRVVRGSLWNLGGQGVTMIATLVATPFVIRLLGPERYGVLALINVVIGYLSFADLGMGWASTRFASEAHALGDDEREASTVWSALLLAAGPALLVAGSLALGAHAIAENLLRLPVHLHETAVVALRFAALGFLGRAVALIMNTPEIVRLRMDLLVLTLSPGTRHDLRRAGLGSLHIAELSGPLGFDRALSSGSPGSLFGRLGIPDSPVRCARSCCGVEHPSACYDAGLCVHRQTRPAFPILAAARKGRKLFSGTRDPVGACTSDLVVIGFSFDPPCRGSRCTLELGHTTLDSCDEYRRTQLDTGIDQEISDIPNPGQIGMKERAE